MPKVLVIINSLEGLYNFRREVLQKLIDEGYDVLISAPQNDKSFYFKEMGCEYIETKINRRSTNIFGDLKLLIRYISIIKKSKPDIILTYTIKPNIYGGIAARCTNTKIIHTVTGLGTVFIQDIWQKKLIVKLNKIAFKNAEKIFYLNEDNEKFYNMLGISDINKSIIVPGSGVNLNKFKYSEIEFNRKRTFTFIGRVFEDKGIDEFLIASKTMKKKYPNTVFKVVGSIENKKYNVVLKKYQDANVIEYLGKQTEINRIITNSTCIVLPSYGEGRGTVLQEGAAVGRPLITCDTYGCRDNVTEGYNGYLCEVKNSKSLENAIEKIINMSDDDIKLMGKNSRHKAEKEFDRNLVVNKYFETIDNVIKGEK